MPLTVEHAAPALSALPGHWVRLDAGGRVLAADPGLGARLGLPRAGSDAPFITWLSPASQVLWATSLWPALTSQGSLNESLLTLATAAASPSISPDTPPGWPAVSFWRCEPGADGATYVGLLVPGLERRRLLGELRQARDSLDAMPGAVLQIETRPDGSLRFPYASSPLLDLLGVTPTQAAAAPEQLLARLTPASRSALQAVVAKASASRTDHWQVVLTPLRQPQRRLEISARSSAQGGVWHGVLTDVSEREQLQQELQHRAETDALTRLPNRTALLAQLRQRLEAGERFALLFMDCDRFKQINDSLGHEAGDELLRHLAQRLRHSLRPADALLSVPPDGPEPMAARLGGDEFVVLADGVEDADAVAAIADRLVRTMAQPYRLQGMELVSPVSVGVILAQPGHSAEQLLRDADTAMYEAKRRARGSWVLFEPEMHQRVASALALEGDLRQALKDGQLRAVFQPIIEIASGRVVGMEALARWHHPVRGEVSPVHFIPVAEESGLINELGERMLQLACGQFAAWQRSGLALPPRLSVNLSRAQLTDHALPERIATLLAGLGLPCSALQLEITESLAMDDASVRLILAALRARGMHLALDDFGTGHSSLASLQHFPVQQVKIDRAFVREIETSAYHRALVQAALQVAQALRLEVVAEGVETAAQARLLAEMGCTRAQGWLYARALEADAVPAFLAGPVPRHLDAQRPSIAALGSVHRAHHVIVTDPQGLTVHVNAAFTLNTGWTLDEMRGRTPGALLQGPETDPGAVRLLRDAQVNGSGCMGVEIINYRKDGTPFTALIDIEAVRDASGQIVQFASLQTEISEHKRIVRELADLRLRIEDVQALGLVGFWERDLLAGSAQADANTLRMLGRPTDGPAPSLDELQRLVTPESRPVFDAYSSELQRGALQGLLEYTVRRDDGSLRDLQVHWSRRGQRVFGVMFDTSGSQRRQTAQLRLLRHVEMAAVAADQFFWVTDLRTNGVTWLPEGHHPFENEDGTPLDAEAIYDAVLPEDRGIVVAARERAQRERGMVEARYRVRRRDGSVRTLLTRRIGLTEADGSVQSVVGVAIDVTPAGAAP